MGKRGVSLGKGVDDCSPKDAHDNEKDCRVAHREQKCAVEKADCPADIVVSQIVGD